MNILIEQKINKLKNATTDYVTIKEKLNEAIKKIEDNIDSLQEEQLLENLNDLETFFVSLNVFNFSE